MVTPAGKILARSTLFTALGPSSRHSPGNPTRSIGSIVPVQPVVLVRLPVTSVTFSERVRLDSREVAFDSAVVQSGALVDEGGWGVLGYLWRVGDGIWHLHHVVIVVKRWQAPATWKTAALVEPF